MIVQVRNSSNTGNAPLALANGELALNAGDQLLYYRHANGTVRVLANGASILSVTIAQVSSNLNQVPANTQAWRVTFNNNDLLIGTSHTLDNSRVSVLSNGWYSIVATGNYLRTSGGGTARWADCWLRKNDTNIPGTTTRTPLPLAGLDIPMSLYHNMRLEENDYIELIQAVSATAGGTGLRPAVALDAGPAMNSVSLRITKLTN